LPIVTRELQPFSEAAMTTGGVGVDTEFFSPRALERTCYYQDVLRPLGGRSTLIGYLTFGGRRRGALILGRVSCRPFRDVDKRRIQDILPALSVADVAVYSEAARPSHALDGLTRREREIVDYLRLGYTNCDIALACGTSFRTVRNQLSSVFAKLGVANRAEAVARAFESRETIRAVSESSLHGTFVPSNTSARHHRLGR
jgi:DNA-binding CsgD family transcriptional regulator